MAVCWATSLTIDANTWNTNAARHQQSSLQTLNEPNEGLFGSIYVNGKSWCLWLGWRIGLYRWRLNGFNNWRKSTAWEALTPWSTTPTTATDRFDRFQRHGLRRLYHARSFTIDKLTLALNLGFTADGYQPDRAFGSGVMIGSADNSRISAIRIGDFGDWLWGGFIASYQFNEALKLTGNFIYADIDAWDTKGVEGDGPRQHQDQSS